MKKINPKLDFDNEYFDVGDINVVNTIVPMIDIKNNNHIELNLQDCITDYPNTSKIIDKVLFQLTKLKGNKTLIISVGLDDGSENTLNALFFGSVFLDISKDSALIPIKEMESIIKTKIEDIGIRITIQFKDSRTNDVKAKYYESK